MRVKTNCLIGIFIIGVALLLNACVVVVKNPDAHAKPHAGTSSVYWYYYPDHRVYYHVTERYYYYPEGQSWRKVKKLPPGWVISKKDRVLLKIAGMPYMQHTYHQQKYPARHNANHPGKQNHADRGGQSHHGNSDRPDEHRSSHVKDHKIPPKADSAAQGHARGKRQTPGQAEFDEKVQSDIAKFGKETPSGHTKSEKETPPGHAKSEKQMPPGLVKRDQQLPPGRVNSVDVAGKSHQKNEHAIKAQHHEEKQNVEHGKAVTENSHDRQQNKKTDHESADKSKDNKSDNKQAKTAGNSSDENEQGKQANNKHENKPAEVTNKGKAKQNSKKQIVAKTDKPVNENAGKPDASSQKAASTEPKNIKGNANKQVKQSSSKAKGKQQDDKDGQDDNSQPDVSEEDTEDKVVELNVNKGKDKTR